MITVDRLTKEEWLPLSADAHLVCFNEKIEQDFNNIDFALMMTKDKTPLNYCTVRILDQESCYWQYGGAFPNSKGTVYSYKGYAAFAHECFDAGFKRITTYIENDNIAMIKIALKVGFKIIGTRNFKGSVLVEFLLEREDG